MMGTVINHKRKMTMKHELLELLEELQQEYDTAVETNQSALANQLDQQINCLLEELEYPNEENRYTSLCG